MLLPLTELRRTAARLALPTTLVLATAGSLAAQSEDDFYQAYFLEHEQGDYAAAAEGYARIVDSRRAPEALREKARVRLVACREELASEDFTRLLPPEVLAYVEVDRPGERFSRVLAQLGLLRAATEQMASGDVGVSPHLVEGVLGLRGAAVAITGFNPMTQEPMGVGILHPGDLDVVRGLIETALPAEAERLGDLEGHEAYAADHVTVVLTSRLVVAGNDRGQVRKVLQRLNGEEHESLASRGDLLGALPDRDGALLSFLVNPKPLLPLASIAAASEPEAGLWLDLLDPASLETLAGSVSLGSQGVAIEVALDLEDGHENRLFHFLRMPSVRRETLARVPAGATGFVAGALNDARRYSDASGDDYVSFMDVGRELFGNLTSFALFALPGDGSATGTPHAGAVLSVNDPESSASLWGLGLGMASLAAGGSLDGETVHVAGLEARAYRMPEGPVIYGALDGVDLFFATSEHALERAVATGRQADSVLDDEAFAPAIDAMNGSETLAIVVHGGRALQTAEPWASGSEADEMRALAPRLEKSVFSAAFSHSSQRLGLRLALTELPKVGDLVAGLVRGQAHDYVAHETH